MIFRFKHIMSKFILISVLLLGFIISYIIGGYFFTRSISSDAKRINYAKQLKSISYELALSAHKIAESDDPQTKKSLVLQFQNKVKEFEKIIDDLRYGNEKLKIKPVGYREGLGILNHYCNEWNTELKPMIISVQNLPEKKAEAVLYEYDFKITSSLSQIDQFEKLLTDRYNKEVKVFDIIRLSVFVFLLGIIVYSLFFARYGIIFPLLSLNEATKKIANGDLDVRVSLKTDDEFGELGYSFNKMAESIKVTEESLYRVNRILRMLSDCNEVMGHCDNETYLLDETSHTIIITGGYLLAWVGYAEQDDRQSVKVVAHAGLDDEYVKALDITWADNELGRGPTGTAIRTGKPVVARDILTDLNFAPWREKAKKMGYASSIALPLFSSGEKVFGALNIYSKESNAFSPEEIKLLTELSYDLSYGIIALRTKDEKIETEGSLRESEKRFHLLAENIKDYAILMLNHDGLVESWNAGAERIKGYSAAEIIGKHFSCFYSKEDIEKKRPEIGINVARNEGRFEEEGWRVRKDGTKFWADIIITALYDEAGNLKGFSKITRDITERKKADDELRLQSVILKNMVEGICMVRAADSIIVYTNPKFDKMFGYEQGELNGKSVTVLHPSGQSEEENGSVANIMAELRKKGEAVYDAHNMKKDGTAFWCRAHTTTLNHPSFGQVWVAVQEDITQHKQMEEALSQAKADLEMKVDLRTAELRQANEKVLIWANEMRLYTQEIILLNQMSEFLQTCTSFEDAYAVIAKFIQQIFPDDTSVLYIYKESRNILETAAVSGQIEKGEEFLLPNDCWALRRGQVHFVTGTDEELRCHHVKEQKSVYMCIPLIARDEIFGMFHIRFNTANIGDDEQKLKSKQNVSMRVASQIGLIMSNMKLRDSLRGMSIRDPLTGLYNRRYMEESLERELRRAERKGTSMAVIMLDFDYFKKFNDTYGHEMGDTMLRKFGAFMLQYIRSSDIGCRYGGEEFIIILPDTTIDIIRPRIEKFRESVKQIKIQYKDQVIGPIAVSMGVAFFPKDGSTIKEILKAADLSLYRAKQTGRDKICVAGEN